MDCFLVPQRDLRCFYAKAVAPKSALFLRDPPHPSQNCNFHLIDKIADFLQNKRVFLIVPRDLHFLSLWGVFLAHLSTRNTFFSLWECPKMGSFP